MSDEELPPIAQEEEYVRGRDVAAIAGLGVLVIALSIAVAAWMIEAAPGSDVPVAEDSVTRGAGRGEERSGPGAPRPDVIGLIEQTLMLQGRRGQKLAEAQELVLSRYRWVDRKKGVVAIPIDEAMKRAREKRKAKE